MFRECAQRRIPALRRQSQMLRRGGSVSLVGEHSAQVELGMAQFGAKPYRFGVFAKCLVHKAFALQQRAQQIVSLGQIRD